MKHLLSNDSLIVRSNVATGKLDTIFRTTPSDRVGVYTSPGHIALVRKEDTDTIGVYSYEISSGKIASSKAYGVGYMPYFDSECISIVSFQREDEAVYEASLTSGLDGIANGDILLEREICKVAHPREAATRGTVCSVLVHPTGRCTGGSVSIVGKVRKAAANRHIEGAINRAELLATIDG